jgi:hypothetical protein
MAYEKRDNSGSFFVNEKKTQDKHADYSGNVMVAGVEYWISVWTKNGSKGEYWSMALTPKEARQSTSAPVSSGTSSLSRATSAPVFQPDLDDEIPF